MKSILLISYNYAPEPTGIGKYNGEMMQWLAKNGSSCAVITAYPYYPHWRVQQPYRKNRFWYSVEEEKFPTGGSIKIYRCPMYVPASPSGVKRIILDFSFLLSSIFPLIYLLFKAKKDLVIATAPAFLFGLPAVLYKKIKGSVFQYHIHDMQIEAARDLGMIKSSFLVNLLFKVERFIFKRADLVSSISDGMIEKLRKKTGREIYFLPNWTDVKNFQPISSTAEIKKGYGFEPKDQIVLYSGAIGQKQGLEAILEAARVFDEKNPDVKFIICGSGPYQSVLKKMAIEKKLTNLTFLPLQPLEKFNAFLNIADVHLVIQKADASDLMMPSKLTAILAVGGLALITANEGSGLYALVKNHSVGLVVEAENQPALNRGIETALSKSEAIQNIRENARKYAELYLDKNEIMKRFEKKMGETSSR